MNVSSQSLLVRNKGNDITGSSAQNPQRLKSRYWLDSVLM